MQENKLDIVMLVGPGQSSRIMYHTLRHELNIKCVILENKVPAKTMIINRIKRLGVINVTGQLLFIFFNKVLAKISSAKRDQLIKQYNLNDESFPHDILKRVESASSDEAIHLLQKYNPGAVVVNGTRILSKKVISSIEAPFINTHMGITPKYRGVHGGYWALANRDNSNCGVTVHLVDEGIDTGGVLYQDIIQPGHTDDFNTYPIHQIAKAAPLMKAALCDVADNHIQVKSRYGSSQLWYHPTLLEYFINRVMYKVK